MITVKQALSGVKLTDAQHTNVQRLDAVVSAEIKRRVEAPGYVGQDIEIALKTPATIAEAFALKRRMEAIGAWRVDMRATTDAYGQADGYKYVLRAVGAPPLPDVPVRLGASATVSDEAVRAAVVRILGGEMSRSPALSDKPALSVLLGTYNRIGHLKRAVQSIRDSVGEESYEIVICDGGSTDGSREWLAMQPDVILIAERRLEGAVKAFNQCFAASRGEFIANLNDDCAVEGGALAEGIAYLRANPRCGQVAFSFRGDGEEWHINDIYPPKDCPTVKHGTTYANFGITRRAAAEQAAYITGGFWSPVYRTYAGDCELSAWIWKLGWTVDKLPHLRVLDTRARDGLRTTNEAGSGDEAKRMYLRWPADAFRPDGCNPRVSTEELERFVAVSSHAPVGGSHPVGEEHVIGGETPGWNPGNLIFGGFMSSPSFGATPSAPSDLLRDAAMMNDWPSPDRERRLHEIALRVRRLDPVDGEFPARVDSRSTERVLHVHLGTEADPQEGLVRAMAGLGSAGYAQVRWPAFKTRWDLQKEIVDKARGLRPTLVFMQLQADNVVDAETVRDIRAMTPEAVIVGWCGDVASENSPWNVDWQVPLARECDLWLHSSMSHVRALRAAGAHNAAYLNIGYDERQYETEEDAIAEIWKEAEREGSRINVRGSHFDYAVSFLGSRYGNGDAFAASMRWHGAELRDEVVGKMRATFGNRFGLFGQGWNGAEFAIHDDGCEYDGDKLPCPGCEVDMPAVVPLAQSHTVYWRSHIGLNVSLSNDLECYSSDRIFRILGCGALLFTKRFPGMSTLGLVDGENCLAFDDADEAVELAKWYMAVIDPNAATVDGKPVPLTVNGKPPQAIAEAGAKLARERHTWDARLREMMALVEAVRT